MAPRTAITKSVNNKFNVQPFYSNAIETVNKNIDYIWALNQQNTEAPKSYFDYYYSGQDTVVFIDGIDDIQIPLEGIAFQVEQKKTPVFGSHSYTYDGVMRGNRIVTGSFRITTTSPGYMTDIISKAADARIKNKGGFFSSFNDKSYIPSISENNIQSTDLDNINRYWTISAEKSRSGFIDGQKNIFSSHPPFSFVLIYGLQTASLQDNVMAHNRGRYQSIMTDNALYTDINERLVETNTNAERVVIDSIEINSCQIEISPDGQPLSETYTFFAKDFFPSKVN